MIVSLDRATVDACGGKADALGVLLRAGLPVPDGFVIPFESRTDGRDQRADGRQADPQREIARELGRMGDPAVAVRSSAADEDADDASAAGQYRSILGVRGEAAAYAAVIACRDSARADRVTDYRARTGIDASPVPMAVIVQRLIDAEVSGVMFTPDGAHGTTRIEASWGLGLTVVGGIVTPDIYQVARDGSIRSAIGEKGTRIDATSGGDVATRPVIESARFARTLDDDAVAALVRLGNRVADLFGRPQDVEWAIADGVIWILQTRPITAPLPPIDLNDAPTAAPAPASAPAPAPSPSPSLKGTAVSHGVAAARARIVRSTSDFPDVRPGEILVCPYTDPAWTPLFTIAAGVITESGGTLSHAAIIAREYGIPAVLGVTEATARIRTGDRLILDGTAGTVTVA